MLEPELLSKIENLIKYPEMDSDSFSKLALFDMDNTLLIGDIGEAVYAQLRAENHKVHIGWHEYKDILKEHGPGIAYRRMVASKKGLTRKTIRAVTKRILESQNTIYFHDNDIEISKNPPKPNPKLNELIKFLRTLDFGIFVITASSKHIADEVCTTWFDLDENIIYGVENEYDEHEDDIILRGELIEPAPILEGKAQVYLNKIDHRSPLIAIGDSLNDVPMLNLVPKEGLKIIVERDPDYTKKIMEVLEDGEVWIIRN